MSSEKSAGILFAENDKHVVLNSLYMWRVIYRETIKHYSLKS